MSMKKNLKSGQTALIVLLIMIVILTITLSLISRSITDIKISQDEQEALRAFSAAEAGIEDMLNRATIGIGTTSVTVGTLTASVTITATGENTKRTINQGETMYLLLEGSSPFPLGLNIYWIDSLKTDETNDKASLEISSYVDDYSVSRLAYNANGLVRSNGFNTGDAGTDGYQSKKQISVVGNTKYITIKALYNKASIMVNSVAPGILATQQYNLTSSVNAAKDKSSKIVVDRTISSLPEIFGYTLFTEGNLSN